MNRLFLLLIAVSLFLGACSSSTELVRQDHTGQLNLPFEEAYDGVIRMAMSIGGIVEFTDRESGIISLRSIEFGWDLSVGALVLIPFVTITESPRDEFMTLVLKPISANETEVRWVRLRYAGSSASELPPGQVLEAIERAAAETGTVQPPG